jgi:hypothetical protein
VASSYKGGTSLLSLLNNLLILFHKVGLSSGIGGLFGGAPLLFLIFLIDSIKVKPVVLISSE